MNKSNESEGAATVMPAANEEPAEPGFDAWWKRKTAWNSEGWSARDRIVAQIAWGSALAALRPSPTSSAPAEPSELVEKVKRLAYEMSQQDVDAALGESGVRGISRALWTRARATAKEFEAAVDALASSVPPEQQREHKGLS